MSYADPLLVLFSSCSLSFLTVWGFDFCTCHAGRAFFSLDIGLVKISHGAFDSLLSRFLPSLRVVCLLSASSDDIAQIWDSSKGGILHTPRATFKLHSLRDILP